MRKKNKNGCADIFKLFVLTLGLIFQVSGVEAKRTGCQKGGNCQNGFGDFYYTDGPRNGDRYAGGFLNGERHGEGTYYWWGARKGQQISAIWAKDRPVEAVQVSYPDGSKYSGGWDMYNGKRGQGKYLLPDGSVWHADWVNDEMTSFAVKYDSWGKVLIESFIHPKSGGMNRKLIDENLEPIYQSNFDTGPNNTKQVKESTEGLMTDSQHEISPGEVIENCLTTSQLELAKKQLLSLTNEIEKITKAISTQDEYLQDFDARWASTLAIANEDDRKALILVDTSAKVEIEIVQKNSKAKAEENNNKRRRLLESKILGNKLLLRQQTIPLEKKRSATRNQIKAMDLDLSCINTL